MTECLFPGNAPRTAYAKGCKCERCQGHNTARAEARRRKIGMPPKTKIEVGGSIRQSEYTVTRTGCWEWISNFTTQGYGRLQYQGQFWQAHRYAFWHEHGYVPDVVRHYICDNPPCVNPAHLRGGTQQDNVDDMWRKGRARQPQGQVGEKHPRAKVSSAVIDQIRSEWDAGGVTQKELAAKYDYSSSQMSNICSRRQYND